MGDTSTKNTMSKILGICTKKGSHFILVRHTKKDKHLLDMHLIGYTTYGDRCSLCKARIGSDRCRYSNSVHYISSRYRSSSSGINNTVNCPLDLIKYYGQRLPPDLNPIVIEVKSGIKFSLFISCLIR